MTMTSSELLPSVMSATWTFRELGLLCQLYAPPFQQRTLVHPKPWRTVDAGVGFSFEPCIPTPAVFCIGAKRQKAPVVREQLGINCLASLTSTATAWPVFGSSWGIFWCIEPVTDMWRMANYSTLHVYLSRDAENGFKRGLLLLHKQITITLFEQPHGGLKWPTEFTKHEYLRICNARIV